MKYFYPNRLSNVHTSCFPVRIFVRVFRVLCSKKIASATEQSDKYYTDWFLIIRQYFNQQIQIVYLYFEMQFEIK